MNFIKIKPQILKLIVFLFVFFSGNYTYAQVVYTKNLKNAEDALIREKARNRSIPTRPKLNIDGYYAPPTFKERKMALIRFDLNSALPSGAVVISAKLKLMRVGGGNVPRDIGVYRVKRSWDVGTVKWSNFNSSDYNSTPLDEQTVIWTRGKKEYIWDVTSSVKSMISGASNNYGWLIKDTKKAGGGGRNHVFASADHSKSNFRPVLEIKYTLPAELGVTVSDNEICSGESSRLTATGGSNYSWKVNGVEVSTNAVLDVSPTETTTYTISATVGGVSSTKSVTVNVNESPQVSISSIQKPTNGECNGQIISVVSGGQISWQGSTPNIPDQPTISGLCPGEYKLTVTSVNGCKKEETVNLDECAPLDITAQVKESCFESNNGKIVLKGTSNGDGSGGGGSGNNNPSCPGEISYPDINCVNFPYQIGLISVEEHEVKKYEGSFNGQIVVDGGTLIICRGVITLNNLVLKNNGRIIIESGSIFYPYEFTIPSGCKFIHSAGTATFMGDFNLEGSYFFMEGSLTILGNYTSNQGGLYLGPNANPTLPPAVSNVKKLTNSDLEACASSGNDGDDGDDYDLTECNITWSGTTQTGPEIVGLVPDSYVATINCDGCIFTETVNVSESNEIQLSIDSVENTRPNQCIGAIYVNASGGKGDFTYEWTGPGGPLSGKEITELCEGEYIVTAQDSNGCSITKTIEITGCSSNDITVNEVSPCFGESNGQITLVSNTNEDLTNCTISWEGTSQTGPVITGLNQGQYVANISCGGCEITKEITLNESDEIVEPELVNIKHVSCNGGNDGEIDINFNSLPITTPPVFSYSWIDNQSSSVKRSSLSSGIYGLEVKNSNCVDTFYYEVNEPSGNLNLLTFVDSISCSGSNDGKVLLSAIGGLPPYSYYSNGQPVQQFIFGLSEGIYNYEVKDSNNCVSQSIVTLSSSEWEPQVSITTSGDSCTGSGGVNVVLKGNEEQNESVCNYENNLPTESCASCQLNVTGSGYKKLSTGVTYCLNQNYAGDIDVNGAKLLVCGNVYLENLILEKNDELVVTGNLTVDELFINSSGVKLINHGNMVINNSLEIFGEVVNYGDLVINNNVVAKSGSKIDNYGTLNLNGTLINESIIENKRVLTISSSISNQNSGVIFNYCTLNALSDLNSNSLIGNKGELNIEGTLTFNSSFFMAYSGSSTVTNDLVIESISFLTNPDLNCSLFKIKSNLDVNNTCRLDGNIDFCIEANSVAGKDLITYSGGAAEDCSCDVNSQKLHEYTYTLPGGGTGDTFLADTTGLYEVVISKGLCKDTLEFFIEVPDSIELSLTSYPTSCLSVIDDGKIYSNVSGGNGDYNYSWTGPDNYSSSEEDIVDLLPGVYKLTVTDGKGCQKHDSIEVKKGIDECVSICTNNDFTFNQKPENCNNQGRAWIDNKNNTQFIKTVSWQSQNSSEKYDGQYLNNPVTDTYEITIIYEDGNSTCIHQLSEAINVEANNLEFAITTEKSCKNGNSGEISISSDIDTSLMEIHWNDYGFQTFNRSGLSSGDYTFTLFDNNGCEIVRTVQIGENNTSCNNCDSIVVSTTANNNLCFGDEKGTINTILSAQYLEFAQFTWKRNDIFYSNKMDLTNLQSGNYSLEVSFSNSECIINHNEIIFTPEELLVSAEVNQSSCSGANNGNIILHTTGGALPYKFNWHSLNNVANTSNAAYGIKSGDYLVTVTDGNDCQLSKDVTLPLNTEECNKCDSIQETIKISDVLCSEDADGSLELLLNGSYDLLDSVKWTNETDTIWTTKSISQLQAGDYSYWAKVTVSDTSCYIQGERTVKSLSSYNIVAKTLNGTCSDSNSGVVSVSTIGGQEPFTYKWNNGLSNNQTVNALSQGDYIVEVKDAYSCSVFDTTTVLTGSNSACICNDTIVSFSKKDISCFGAENGQISLFIPSEVVVKNLKWTGPYNYSSDQLAISGLRKGNYTVEMTYALSNDTCSVLKSFEVYEPQKLNISAKDISNVSCDSVDNGYISVSTTGGSPDYAYLWLGKGVNTNKLSNLSDGTYTVRVTDSKNCELIKDFKIDKPVEYTCDSCSQLSINVFKSDESCSSSKDGELDVKVNAPVSAINQTFQIIAENFVSTSYSNKNLSPGTYDITFEAEINGEICSKTQTVEIKEANRFDYLLNFENASSDTSNDAKAYIINSGFEDLNYLWSNGETSQSVYLQSGINSVQISNENGCTVIDTFEIVSVSNEDFDTCAKFTINLEVLNQDCNSESTQLSVTSEGNDSTVFYNWTSNNNFTSSENQIDVPEGIYFVEAVTNLNGNTCSRKLFHEVESRSNIFADLTLDGFGCDDSSGVLSVSLIEGLKAPVRYTWSRGGVYLLDGINADSLIISSEGQYDVLLTDADNCELTISKTIVQGDGDCNCSELTYDINISDIKCFGENNGEASITFHQNTASVSKYEWSDNNGYSSDQAVASGLKKGDYKLFATVNYNGSTCVVPGNFSINEPVQLSGVVETEGISCHGKSDGIAKAVISGGTGLYSYSWAVQGSSLGGLNPGSNVLIVSDANSCQLELDYTIADNYENCSCDTFSVSLFGTNTSCDDLSEISITAIVYPELPNINYSWSNIDDELFSLQGNTLKNVPEGQYVFQADITLQDGGHCNIQREVGVKLADSALNVDFDIVHACENNPSGSIVPDVVQGSGTYFTTWCMDKDNSIQEDFINGNNCNIYTTVDSINGLEPGNYSVHVRDGYGCEVFRNIEILNLSNCSDENNPCLDFNPELSVSNITISNLVGSINVDLGLGLNPSDYTYKWTNERNGYFNEVTQNITNLNPGLYTVEIKAKSIANGFQCSATRVEEVYDLHEDPVISVYEGALCNTMDVKIDSIFFYEEIDGEGQEVVYTGSDIENKCSITWEDTDYEGAELLGVPKDFYYAYINCEGKTAEVEAFYEANEDFLSVDVGLTICKEESHVIELGGSGSFYWYEKAGEYDTNITTLEQYQSLSIPSTLTFLNDKKSSAEAAPLETTTYYIVYKGEKDSTCITLDYITISVVPAPIVSVSPDQTICEGETITLEAAGGEQYSWSNSLGNEKSIEVSPESTQLYKVEISGDSESQACKLTRQILVTVLDRPNWNTAGGFELCNGEQKLVPFNGVAALACTPDQGIEIDNHNIIFKPTATTSYSVVGTADNGCEVSQEIAVNVLPKFNPVAEIDHSACLGNEFQLTVTEGETYLWTPQTAHISSTTIRNPIIQGTDVVETYSVTVTDKDGCLGTSSIEVRSASIVGAGQDEVKCLESGIQLEGNGGNTYNWIPDDGIAGSSVSNPIINVTATTNYTVSSTNEYGCNYQDQVTVTVDPTCSCFEQTENTKTYYWTGANSNIWSDLGNWSITKSTLTPPTILPAENDNVVIDILKTDPNYPILESPITLRSLCVLEGRFDLAGFEVTLTRDGIYTDSEIISADPASIKMVHGITGDLRTMYIENTQMAPSYETELMDRIYLNGGDFVSETKFDLNSDKDLHMKGNNIYQKDVSFKQHGTAVWAFADLTQGGKDQYYANAAYEVTGTGEIKSTSKFSDNFKGNIYINSDNISFGSDDGVVIINGSSKQFIDAYSDKSKVARIKNLIVDKPILSDVAQLELGIAVEVGTENEGNLSLVKGNIITQANTLLTVNNNATITDYSDESFVDGPLKIIGNDAFTFPVGKGKRYMPVILSDVSGNDVGYTLEFINESPEDRVLGDNLNHLSECEFWTIDGPEDPEMLATLTWDSKTCDLPFDLSQVQIAYYNSISWKSAGSQNMIGSKAEGGSAQSLDPLNNVSRLAFGSNVAPGHGEALGFSFNNYGAYIEIESSTDLDIYGNFMNENSDNEEPGEVVSFGEIKVEKDWTNYADNEVFKSIAEGGEVYLIGAYQRLRGTEPTQFNNFYTHGNGLKEMFVNEKIGGIYVLSNNETYTRNHLLYVNNSDSGAVVRAGSEIGFVSSSNGGFLKRDLISQGSYLFPVGHKTRYRPVSLKPESNQANSYSIRMVPKDPETDEFYRFKKSLFVNKVNNNFYHVIERDIEDTNSVYSVSLSMQYEEVLDGVYQDIGHWDNNATPDVVNGTETISFGPVIPADKQALTNDQPPYWRAMPELKNANGQFEQNISKYTGYPENYKVIKVTGVNDFTTPQFALIKKGYLLNTAGFGNPGSTGGTGSTGSTTGGVTFTFGGDGFTDGSITYTTDDTTSQNIAPDVLGGTDTLYINEDIENIGGKIAITTDNNGGVTDIVFVDGDGIPHILSTELIDTNAMIDPLTGVLINLNSGNDAPLSCIDNLKITLNGAETIIGKQSENGGVLDIKLEGITSTDFNSLTLTSVINPSSSSIFTWSEGDNGTFSWTIGTITKGLYNIEISLKTDNGGNAIVKGQLIIKE